jgi:hypothetical protein
MLCLNLLQRTIMIMKTIFTFALAFAICLSFNACNNAEEVSVEETEVTTQDSSGQESHEGHDHEMEASAGAYYCPMKCEGDKTYEDPGKCAVCGMDLVSKS